MLALGCLGEGGRGMVVVRWGNLDEGGKFEGEGGEDGVFEGGGVAGGRFMVPVARTWERILLDPGAAGEGWWAVVAGGFGIADSFDIVALAFCVPMLRAASTGVLFAATGDGGLVRGGATGFGASFFAATFFIIRAGAFFSLMAFSLPLAAFVLAIFTPAGCCGVTTVPASSATTFFGRPRFFKAGGSIVVVMDIAADQLIIRWNE